MPTNDISDKLLEKRNMRSISSHYKLVENGANKNDIHV